MKKLITKKYLILLMLLMPGVAFSASSFSCVGDSFCGATPYSHQGTLTLGTQSDSPTGNPGVWKWIYPAGTWQGLAVGAIWVGNLPNQTEMWIQYYWKVSPGFQYYPAASNKQVYFHPSNTMGMGLVGGIGVNLMPQEGGNLNNYWPNVYTSIWYMQDTGVWHKYKGYYKMNSAPGVWDGLYKAWVDDVMVSNYSSVSYWNVGEAEGAPNYFHDTGWVVIHGGMIEVTIPEQYLYTAGMYVGDTDPGGAGAGDASPPYVDTYSPGNGSTGIAVGTTSFSFHFKDSGTGATGANSSSLSVNCSGYGGTKTCASGLTCTGTSADYTVTYGSLSLGYDNLVSCTINGSDLASPVNTMAQQNYSFTVQANPNPSLAVSTTSLPSGTVGVSYSATLAATGGTSPYTWDKSAGTLPTGLVVPSSGTGAWGVPSAAGTFTATYRATDAASATATKSLSITIVPAPPGGQTTQNTNFADTFINSGSPTVNYGDNAALRVYQWPYAVVANRIIIFDNVDIQSIPSNKNIDSAKLRLYLTGYEGSGGTNPMRIYAYRITGTLPDTTTVTWNNFAGTLTQLGYTNVALTSGWYEWDVTSAVAAAYAANPRVPVYIALDGKTDGAQDTNRAFASIDHATTAWRPQLVVSYSDNIVLLPPNPPTPHSVAAGDAQVMLRPGTSSGALFYSAYYTSDGSTPSKTNGTLIAGVTDNQVLSGLSNGTTYKFVFTASNASGESVVSSVDSATPVAAPAPIPSAPTSILVTSLNASVTIYPGTSSGATSYNCYYTSDGSTPTKSAYGVKITGATGGQMISGLTNGVTYKFVFTAVNAAGESAESGVLAAIPQAALGVNFLIGTGNSVGNITTGQAKNFLQ